MGFLKEPKSSKFDRDPALASPLAAAISAQDRETLAMVASALKDRRMRLAFQPVVYAADPAVIAVERARSAEFDRIDRHVRANRVA